MQSLLPEPPATYLPANDEADVALAAAQRAGTDEAYVSVAANFPSYSASWGELAARALGAGAIITAYVYARTGYHRGLDQLRRNGWQGYGTVPWSHTPNQGFLRCLHLLSRTAGEIGEADEAARCAQFVRDCDPAAADALSSE